jgi:alkanesulfonate monooxygenase SsuD/methylene tetrahydromethanopterin reductase-like flavin-dependent oxidoreductase (luciferase family)
MNAVATSQPVEIGLSLPNRAIFFGLTTETLLECAQIADESGEFGSVWVGDNLISKPRLEAMILLSAVAARTKKVRLGTVCLASFPMRNPLVFGLQWASLDVLSGGRSHLVVCSGGPASYGPKYAAELAATGVASKERIGRVEEGIEVLRRLWTEDDVTFEGRYYQLPGVTLAPKPIQAHVPIDIAVNPPTNAASEIVERALRRVAKLSDGWQTDGTPPDVFRDRWSRVLRYAREYGREDQVRTSSLHLMVNINENPEAAWDEAFDFLDRYYGFGAKEDLSPDQRAKLSAWIANGSPEQVAAKIQTYIDAGCTTPILRFCAPDPREQLGRCIKEVLPLVRRQPVTATLAG